MTLTKIDDFSVEEETIIKRVYVLKDLKQEKQNLNEEILREEINIKNIKDEIIKIDLLIDEIQTVININK